MRIDLFNGERGENVGWSTHDFVSSGFPRDGNSLENSLTKRKITRTLIVNYCYLCFFLEKVFSLLFKCYKNIVER